MNQDSVQENNNEIPTVADFICKEEEIEGTNIVVLLRDDTVKRDLYATITDNVFVVDDEKMFFDIHEKVTALKLADTENLAKEGSSSKLKEDEIPKRLILREPHKWKTYEQVEKLLCTLHSFIIFIFDSYTNSKTLYLAHKSYIVNRNGGIESVIDRWD